jgi:preprotein translocase subunit SecA
LRGRSGRQGDPGESRFYLSLGDDLMQRFNANAVEAIMDRLNIPDDVPIESKLVSRQIQSAQTQLEQQNAEIRKNVLKYDEVLNKQRQVIYAERRQVLDGADLQEQVRHMIDDSVEEYVKGATAEGYAEEWDLDQLLTSLKQLYPVSFTAETLEEEAGGRNALDAEFLAEKLKTDAQEAYDRREKELGADALRELERQVVLSVLDRKWREHLYEMDYLQEGIGLRAYAQRDPLVEYQREGFDLFNGMMEAIKEESVGFLFNLEVQVEEEPSAEAAAEAEHHVEVHAKGLGAPSLPPNLQYSAPVIDGEAGAGAVSVASGPLGSAGPSSPTAAGERGRAPGQKVGAGPSRNSPCPCGSGKKYKRCHGAPSSA